MIILSILFFVTAILYSSVGFGGGSTYLALLFIWGVPYFIFPLIALACNIVVVSGNCFKLYKGRKPKFKIINTLFNRVNTVSFYWWVSTYRKKIV